MNKSEKKCINLDFILERDEMIKYLYDIDLDVTLLDYIKIRRLIKLLLKVLRKGSK